MSAPEESAPTATPTATPTASPVPAIIGAVIGLPMLAYGVWGAIDERSRTKPWELARWVIGADIVHDAIWAPVIVAASWLIGRLIPRIAQTPVRWASATTAVLALIAWPFLRGYGRDASIPSLLDRNYATGLLTYIAVVWVIALGWSLWRVRAARGPVAEG